jgi:GAF domain-containing protein
VSIVFNRKWNHLYARQQRGVLDPSDRLNLLLETGRDAFGLEDGLLSRITDHHYTIQYTTFHEWLNLQVPLYYTYCDLTLKINDVYAVSQAPFANHPGQRMLKIESYIGAPIWVNDCLYGTIAFFGTSPRRENFNERDKNFLRGIVRSAAHVLNCY